MWSCDHSIWLFDLDNTLYSPRVKILDNINAGIQAEQCACDLRNPQGACCLGNVRAAIKRLEMPIVAMAP